MNESDAMIDLIKRHSLILSLALLAGVTGLSLTPLPEMPGVPGTDKAHHLIAYGAVMFPVALRRAKSWLWMAAAFALWGGLIELAQPHVNRYGEWTDWLANIAGLLCGALAAILVDVAASRFIKGRQRQGRE